MMCERCKKKYRETYTLIKNIEVIESNSKYINFDFRIDNLCENCLRLMFEKHRDKMISFIELDEYLENLSLEFDTKYIESIDNELLISFNSKRNLINEIRKKIRGVVL